MKRNVLLIGGKTHIVSLPSQWIRKYDIKKGDELSIEEDNSRLIISTNKQYSQPVAKIDISGFSPILLNKMLYASYIKGADDIYVVYSNSKEAILIHEAVKTMIGCTIVEETKTQVHIKDVYGPATEFEPIMRRIFFMAHSIIQEGTESIKSKETDFLGRIKLKDYELGDNVNFCLRYLNKKGYKDYRHTSMIYTTLRNLENLIDEFYWLFKFISESKIKTDKEVIKVLQILDKMFDCYAKLVFQYNREKLEEFSSYSEKLAKDILILSKSLPKGETGLIGPLWAVATRMFDLIEPNLEEQI